MNKVTIDRIGTLRASIAELQAELKDLEGIAKCEPAGAYEGELFRITISWSDRKTTAWQKIAKDLGASNQKIAANTKQSEVCSLRCTARAK